MNAEEDRLEGIVAGVLQWRGGRLGWRAGQVVASIWLVLGTLIIGGLLGVCAGINMGKNRPVLSNPFKDDSFSGRMKDTGNDLMRKSGEAMEDAGKAIKDQFN